MNQQQRLRLSHASLPNLQRSVVVVRRLAVRHLQRRDAERPDVHLACVAHALNQLGRHPERRAHHRLAPLALDVRETERTHLGGETHGEAEVGEFDLALPVDEDVVRFDV